MVSNGGVLGEEDILDSDRINTYLTSARCESEIAELFEVRSEDFLKEYRKQVNYNEITGLIQSKREKFANRIMKKSKV